MVTCKLSHRIESLGEAGVGRGVGVDVGSGVCVAVAVTGMDDLSLLVEQAVTRNTVMSNMRNDFFMGTPSNSNT